MITLLYKCYAWEKIDFSISFLKDISGPYCLKELLLYKRQLNNTISKTYRDTIKEHVYHWWTRIEHGNYMNMAYHTWKRLRNEKNVLYFKTKVLFGITSISVIMNFFFKQIR